MEERGLSQEMFDAGENRPRASHNLWPRLPYLEKGGSVPAHPAGAGEDQLGTHQVAFKLEGWHYSGSPLSS